MEKKYNLKLVAGQVHTELGAQVFNMFKLILNLLNAEVVKETKEDKYCSTICFNLDESKAQTLKEFVRTWYKVLVKLEGPDQTLFWDLSTIVTIDSRFADSLGINLIDEDEQW